MSTGRRAYDLLRSYVNHEWDRITHVDDQWDKSDFQNALDRLKAKRDELSASSEASNQSVPAESEPIQVPALPEDQKRYARSLLGVAEDATFEADSSRFLHDSTNVADASSFHQGQPSSIRPPPIQKRVHWALGVLTKTLTTPSVGSGALKSSTNSPEGS